MTVEDGFRRRGGTEKECRGSTVNIEKMKSRGSVRSDIFPLHFTLKHLLDFNFRILPVQLISDTSESVGYRRCE